LLVKLLQIRRGEFDGGRKRFQQLVDAQVDFCRRVAVLLDGRVRRVRRVVVAAAGAKNRVLEPRAVFIRALPAGSTLLATCWAGWRRLFLAAGGALATSRPGQLLSTGSRCVLSTGRPRRPRGSILPTRRPRQSPCQFAWPVLPTRRPRQLRFRRALRQLNGHLRRRGFGFGSARPTRVAGGGGTVPAVEGGGRRQQARSSVEVQFRGVLAGLF
jgi:hypothetical protein